MEDTCYATKHSYQFEVQIANRKTYFPNGELHLIMNHNIHHHKN